MTETAIAEVSEQQVIDYLRRHADFLKRHPDLLSVLSPPARDLGGDGVVDFQAFQLKNLQKNATTLQSKYEGLVDYCRDNLSVQHQVHDAVLRLIKARNLEQLLEVITVDLVALFDLDVVRLAVESDAAAFYETYYTEHHASGIVFIPPGLGAAMLANRKALLVEDAQAQPPPGFADIFADCAGQIRSFALLKLEAGRLDHGVLLAFGVRYAGRFHSGQAVDLLSFLARIVTVRLDAYLDEVGP